MLQYPRSMCLRMASVNVNMAANRKIITSLSSSVQGSLCNRYVYAQRVPLYIYSRGSRPHWRSCYIPLTATWQWAHTVTSSAYCGSITIDWSRGYLLSSHLLSQVEDLPFIRIIVGNTRRRLSLASPSTAVRIPAIAWSTTSLDTQTVVMCTTSQCKLRSLRANGERNLHCDVVHITTVWVSSHTLDCNGVLAIQVYDSYFGRNRGETARDDCFSHVVVLSVNNSHKLETETHTERHRKRERERERGRERERATYIHTDRQTCIQREIASRDGHRDS